MSLFIKKILYRILVLSMITVCLSFFSASSVVHAKITLDDTEFYYTGTQNSEVMFEATFWQKTIKQLKQIANYLIGVIVLSIRAVVIGYIEIMEIVLTALLGELGTKEDFWDYMKDSLEGLDTYSQRVVNVERIIFNKVKLFKIDMFGGDEDSEEDNTQPSGENPSGDQETKGNAKVIEIAKKSVAEWYVSLRLVVIAMMLILLIFIGVKMAIATVASEKSVYKQMLIDWVVGIILIFSIHYIMAFVVHVNNQIIKGIGNTDSDTVDMDKPYEFGDQSRNNKTPSEVEFTLYESARTRAYSVSLLDGIAGTIIYGALVYFAWKYALIYFRRLLNIMILTIISPIIAGTYAFNKTMSGGSPIYSNWLKEYIINVIIQVFHAILYITLVSAAFKLAIESLLGVALAIALLSAMEKFGDLLRQLFNISGGSGSLFEEMLSKSNFQSMKSAITNIPNAIVGGTMGKNALKFTGRVATKPVRKAAETGFGKIMEKTANSKRYKDWKSSRDDKKEAKANELYNEFSNSPEYANERAALERREEELANKKDKLKNEKNNLKRQLDIAKNTGNQTQIDDLTKKLEDKEAEEEQNNKDIIENQNDIADFESGVQRGFIDYYMRSQTSWDVIKQNFGNLFDPDNYVDKEDITADEIEKKASEMFSDYDKYKEVIENGGRSKEDAELYKKYSEMKELIDKRKSLSDQVKNLQKKSLTNPNQYSEELAQAKASLQQVEDNMRSKYSEYFPNEKTVNQSAVDELFDNAEQKVAEMKKKLSDGGEAKERKEKDAVKNAHQKLNEMEEQAKEALTVYKMKKTKREGDSNYAFWRKKKSGVGKIFLDNAKIDKILGISSEEKKVLKDQFKDAKKTVLGVASGIAGLGLLGSNPKIGLPLLANAMNTRLETFSNMRMVSNAPSRLKYKYKFSKFGEGSQKVINDQMGKEIRFAESKMTKLNIQRHPVLKKIINTTDDYVIKPIVKGALTFSGVAVGAHFMEIGRSNNNQQPYEGIPESHYKRKIIASDTFYRDKLDDIYQKRVRKAIKEAQKELVEMNTKTFEDEYKEESKKYKQKIRDDVKNESTEDLIMEEVLSSDDVVQVDADTFIEYEDSDMPSIDFGSNNVTFGKEFREQRIEQIKNLIEDDKKTLIQMAIFNLSMSKKITEISNLSIDDRDIMAIRKDIKERFERKGHLRKGELKINDIISENDVKETLNNLKRSNGGSNGKDGSANDRLANMMVKKACMTYMAQNGITDPKQLNSQQAHSQIETMIANQLISKSTQEALAKMGGQSKITNTNLTGSLANIGDKIDTVSQKMKVKNAKQVKKEVGKKHSRRELAERSIIRRENAMKSNLESAMYTGDDSSVVDEAQLKMLFLLSEIGKQNRISQKVDGKKTKKTKNETLNELRYEQFKSKNDVEYLQYNGELLTSREEDLNVLLHGRKDIIDIINNK